MHPLRSQAHLGSADSDRNQKVTEKKLPRRPLGRSGIDVSLLGLGLVKIGRNQGVKYPERFSLPTDDEVLALLTEADNLGITLLDTAPAYGTSEARLGKALQQLPGLASRCVISTKVGETFDATSGSSSFDFSPAAIRQSVERSLTRLERSTLDIVFLHSSGADADVLTEQKPLETLQRLQSEGLIRVCGFSGKTLAGGRQALALGAEALMITLNSVQQDEAPLLAEAHAQGAGILIKKPLASGHSAPESLTLTANLPQVASLVVGTLNQAHLRANVDLLAPLKANL